MTVESRALRHRALARFRDTCGKLDKIPSEDVVDAVFWSVIEPAYSEPGRFYHTLNHVMECFDSVDSIVVSTPANVDMALWFHDVVYDTKRKDNEASSAEVARTTLQTLLGIFDEDFTKNICNLILATKTHTCSPSDSDCGIFLDADLAILGSSPERFDEYCIQIRNEYSWVPEAVYAAARRTALQSFLDRGDLFFSETNRIKYESAARRNLSRAVQL